MRHVHLVGSVPLRDAREVFTSVSGVLGQRLKRIPDGETGARSDWITWLEPAFADNPSFEKSDELFRVHPTGTARIRYKLGPNKSVHDVRFDNLFYADIAKASFTEFAALKTQGVIPKHLRFQIDLVPAHSVIWLFLQDDLHQPLDPIYNEALKREIDKIAAILPHDQIAIQFDVASAVFVRLQRGEPSAYGKTRADMLASFARILTASPITCPPTSSCSFIFATATPITGMWWNRQTWAIWLLSPTGFVRMSGVPSNLSTCRCRVIGATMRILRRWPSCGSGRKPS